MIFFKKFHITGEWKLWFIKSKDDHFQFDSVFTYKNNQTRKKNLYRKN